MTRFFAHLCLYLQTIDVTSPALATQVILEAYLQVLEVSLNFGGVYSQSKASTEFITLSYLLPLSYLYPQLYFI